MDQAELIEIAAAIADGSRVDWDALAPPFSHAFALPARVVERIAQVHARMPPVETFGSSLHKSLAGVCLPGDGTAPPEAPVTWGALTIVEKIGRGTFGDVYRAHDRRLNRPVALKLLRRKDSLESVVIDEGQLMARVRHPNVVTVYGAERIDARVGMWMQFVDGPTLEEEVKAGGPFTSHEVADAGIQLAQALGAVHRAGLLHRDVKAQNAMRDADGRVLLTDFGTGRELSESAAAGGHELAGTPLYMAPELLNGEPASVSSDVYSLGVLLYHLATGSFPVSGRSLGDLRKAHEENRRIFVRSARPDVARRLAVVIDRATDPDANRRYRSAEDLEAALVATTTPGMRRAAYVVATVILLSALTALAATPLISLVWGGSDAARTDEFVVAQHARLTWDAGLEIDPEISHDGRFVAYSAGHPGYMRVLVREIASGRTLGLTERAMGDERRPRWSPDGSRVLFTVDDVIYTVTTDFPGRPVRIISAPGLRSATWSHDGRTLLFFADDTLFEVDARGGTPQPLRAIEADAVELSVSADGSRIAYVTGNPEFDIGTTQYRNMGPRVVRISGKHRGSSIALTDERRTSASPIWSADARSLFFVYDPDGRRDVHVVLFDAAGIPGPPRRITNGLDPTSISLSRDGRFLAYSSFTRSSNVWSVDIPSEGAADIRSAVSLTHENQTVEDPVLSPDGRWVYFPSDRHGNSDVFRLRIGERHAERLTSHLSDEFANDVSPDGREVAFHAFRNGRREVFVMPAEGGQETYIAPGLAAQWSPDHSQLLIADVRIDERVGTTHRVLSRVSSVRYGPARSLGSLKCSQLEWTPGSDGFVGLCSGVLMRRGLDGRVLQTLYPRVGGDPKPSALTVSPAGVYFKSYDEEGRAMFWSLPLESGAPRLLLHVDDPSRRSNRSFFSTDGRALYLTLEERQGDVWIASLGRRQN